MKPFSIKTEETDNTNLIQIDRRISIKSRLQRYFLFISLAIILLMSVFSLVYFYNSTLDESTSTVRNKLVIADIFLKNKLEATEELATNLAANRSVQIGLELGSGAKLNEYIESLETNGAKFHISVFSDSGQVLTEASPLSPGENEIVQKALQGTVSTSPCLTTANSSRTPSYVSAVPVLYNDDIIGAVLVKFVFVENQDFFAELSKNLECEIAVYTDVGIVVSTGELPISSRLYKNIAYSEKNYEELSLASAGLSEYKTIFDKNESPVALLRIFMPSYEYQKIFLTALVAYFILATIIVAIVISLVLKISAGILNPIEQLLSSVNVIRSGDLSHEVMIPVQDEIGRLGAAFNELRAELNEKITTIENMNQSLEQKITERTATINTLNSKMRHYLSPQLYASIAGGDRDASVDHYYRKKLTVFFSDVVNFTATTEALEPEDLSSLLNSYLDKMAIIAQKYGGTIDKYVGDAIMVFFGDPEFTSDKDHALRAVKMAMDMQNYMITFREEWRGKGIENPFHVRVGINTGFCTVGNFGSEMKMDYTIIGNNVNMAARFEAAAEPDTILMSPNTYMLVKDEIECVLAGEFTMKGISGTIKAYRPIKVKGTTNLSSLAKITSQKELIFPNKPVSLRSLSLSEKRSLLISLRDMAEEIIGDIKSNKTVAPVKVKNLDSEENKSKKV